MEQEAWQVLIVEDDQRLAELTRDYLEANGLRVSIEGNGALAAARIIKEKPDLVILDLMLPGEDGLSICRKVRDQYDGPILMLTARTDDTDQVRAKANVAEMLVAHPEVAALVGLWSYNGPAILNAARDAGKVGQVKIITFDEDDETLAGVKAGAIVGTVVQQPFEFGYQSMTRLAKVVKGDRSAIPPSRLLFIPTMVIRQSTVDDFQSKLRQLRGR